MEPLTCTTSQIKSCTTHDSGWCNIPNKEHFNPTEQMIVAYHKGTIAYIATYEGIVNYKIKIACAKLFNQHFSVIQKVMEY